ncbi:MAG: hypothetical protein M3176_15280, partial [Chloroflexota bacterium]|nr:hypothetical protein [Chloroflexota bacterium]
MIGARSGRSNPRHRQRVIVVHHITVVTQAELAVIFIAAGLLVVVIRAFPKRLKARLPFLSVAAWPVVIAGALTSSRD